METVIAATSKSSLTCKLAWCDVKKQIKYLPTGKSDAEVHLVVSIYIIIIIIVA